MSKMINIVEDLHKGINLKELAQAPTTKEQKEEEKDNEQHQGHGEQ